MRQFKRGQIWMAEMPKGKGSEQQNERPVIILQNDIGNYYSPTVTVISLTGQSKKWMPTHVTLHKTNCLARTSIALAEQISTIDKERFKKYIGMVNPQEMFEIEDAAMTQLGIRNINKNNIAYA